MIRLAVLATVALTAPAAAEPWTWAQRNTDFPPAFPEQFRATTVDSGMAMTRTNLAEGLVNPWGIATLPDGGGWLVTERAGRLRHLAADGTLSDAIAGLPEVLPQRQGGLLDVALGPTFAEDRRIYVTYAKPVEGGTATAAAGMTLAEDLASVSEVDVIFEQTPPSPTPLHFGSRIVFPGDGTAFVTTGEHSSDAERPFAQDLDKTYGKVVRVNLDGSTPEGMPFADVDGAADVIWSLGHRNIQGATLDPEGRLWTIEHGPQGGDELNRPEAGLNYGWPVISYGERYSWRDTDPGGAIGIGQAVLEGMEQPVYFWDPVIAPGGMAFHSGAAFSEWNGDLLIGSLKPGGVVRLSLDDAGLVVEEERLLMDLGRVRDVEVLEDGSFIVLTDFEDGWVVHVTPG